MHAVSMAMHRLVALGVANHSLRISPNLQGGGSSGKRKRGGVDDGGQNPQPLQIAMDSCRCLKETMASNAGASMYVVTQHDYGEDTGSMW
jgi:hypothetical protein